ncbi:MAG: LysM peptidoglycan-binding domain-containing protein [Bdellovibrionales bacterium]
MKNLILYLILSLYFLTGCSYLGFKSETDTSIEEMESLEESSEDEEYDEDEEDMEEEDEEEEDDDEEEDEEDMEDEDEEYEDEDDGSYGIVGFFKRLFGIKDKSDLEEEVIDDEEGYEEDGDEEYIEDEEEEDEEKEEDEDEEEYDVDDYEEIEEEEDDKNNYEEKDDDYSSLEDQDTSSDIGDAFQVEEDSSLVQETTPTLEDDISETTPQTPVVKKNRPLQKIKTTPYEKSSYLVNGVYIVRPGDTLKSISQKIYESDQVATLYKINPHLKNRALAVGNKIYYNSPQRPNDRNQLLFYYEDFKIPPSTHILSVGDNIRNVFSQLLGHPKSWKEIWSTNPDLQAKWKANREVKIFYWPVGSKPPEPEPMPEPETPPMQADTSLGEDGEEAAGLPEIPSLPEINIPEKEDYIYYINFVMKNKESLGIMGGFLLLIILMLKILVRKRRQRKAFDYTSPDVRI